jgi:predicted phosphodiesterase
MFLKRAKESEDSLFLGVGDYMDSYSTSEREIQYHHAKHDSTREREENEDKSRVRGFSEEIGFMRGRLIGLINGNHYQVYPDGTNSDQYLATLLRTRYLGVCSAIRINLHCGDGVEKIDIFCHHGRGGGRTSVGRFNAVEQLAKISDAEVILMGDNHARGVIPMTETLEIVSANNGNPAYIRSRPRMLGRTGSFLKHYEDGKASYVVDAAMAPASLGWIEFYITPRKSKHRGQAVTSVEIRSWQ